MNALDFAAQLDSYAPAEKGYMLNEAATMLRKQDAAIKQLREALEAVKENSIDLGAIACATDALAATEEFQK
jgi:hypothetical protein